MSFTDMMNESTPENAAEYNFKTNCLNSLDKYAVLLNDNGYIKKPEGSKKSSTNPVLIFFMLLLGIGIGILIYRFLICKNK